MRHLLGAVWACTVAGIDSELAFAVPIYGCGYLSECPGQVRTDAPRWWDPAHHLADVTAPTLFVTGTDDICFPIRHWQATVDACAGAPTQLLLPGLRHGHEAAWSVPEPYEFARRANSGELIQPPPRATLSGPTVSVLDTSAPTSADWYTTSADHDTDRADPPAEWTTHRAAATGAGFEVEVAPAAATGFFLLTDPTGYRRSTQLLGLR